MRRVRHTDDRAFSHHDCGNARNGSPRLCGGRGIDLNPDRAAKRAIYQFLYPHDGLPIELQEKTIDFDEIAETFDGAVDAIGKRLKDPLGRKEAARRQLMRERDDQAARQRQAVANQEAMEKAFVQKKAAEEAERARRIAAEPGRTSLEWVGGRRSPHQTRSPRKTRSPRRLR
jgi:hypothetical protein